MLLSLAIFLGGGVGASLRHLITIILSKALGHHFPFGIFIINILGCFLMGLFVSLFGLFWSASQEVRAFLTVGLLGGFTTFSSFSIDCVVLYQRGDWLLAVGYLVGSVVLSLAFIVIGMNLPRLFINLS